MADGTVFNPLVIANLICAENNLQLRANMVSTSIFMVGICTLLQVTIGVRLPIIQGSSPNVIASVAAMMALDTFKCRPTAANTTLCPNKFETIGNKSIGAINSTGCSGDVGHYAGANDDDLWAMRINELSGCLMLASLVQVLAGATGLIGFLSRFIGPMTVVPIISLIGFTLMQVTTDFASTHWGIAMLTTLLVIIFSLFLRKVNVPIPVCGCKEPKKGCHVTMFPVFQVFPIILAVGIMWSICAILTVTDSLTNDPEDPAYKARTDKRSEALYTAKWFFFPYPGMYGMPTVGVAGFVAILAALIASVVESVADYNACAKICHVPAPPAHAVNRGILIEGFGSIISGAVGACHATTSYSENIGIIGMTKIGSRRVFQVGGVLLVLLGVFGKLGAALATIPEPILGGVSMVTLGLLTAVGLSCMRYADCSSTRNLTILGLGIYGGLVISRWTSAHPHAIKTGTIEERGLVTWRNDVNVTSDIANNNEAEDVKKNPDLSLYDIPIITKYLYKKKIFRYIPFLPSFKTDLKCWCRSSKSRED